MQLSYRQKNNGMYILSRSDIEEIAEAILKEYSPKKLLNPMPLDTIDLLENHLGLTVKRKYIGTIESEVLGLVVMSDSAEIPSYDDTLRPVLLEETYGTVLINRNLIGSENVARRRFTEAHEGAHFILHKEYFRHTSNASAARRRYIACRRVELENDKPNNNTEWLEWQADSLAAALLMPKSIFASVAVSCFNRSRIYDIAYLNTAISEDRALTFSVLKELSGLFNVSYKAAKLRMKHLGLLREPA